MLKLEQVLTITIQIVGMADIQRCVAEGIGHAAASRLGGKPPRGLCRPAQETRGLLRVCSGLAQNSGQFGLV